MGAELCLASRDVHEVYSFAEEPGALDADTCKQNATDIRQTLENYRKNPNKLCQDGALEQYKSMFEAMCEHWKQYIRLSKAPAPTVPLCGLKGAEKDEVAEAIVKEATWFNFLAEGLLHYAQVKQFVTLQLDPKRGRTTDALKEELEENYKTVCNFSTWSASLVLSKTSACDDQGLTTEDDTLPTNPTTAWRSARSNYQLSLVHQMIANCCLYDLTRKKAFLKTAHQVALRRSTMKRSDYKASAWNLDIAIVKRDLRFRGIATQRTNGEDLNDDVIRERLADNKDMFEFCLRTILNIDRKGGMERHDMKVVRVKEPVVSEHEIINFVWTNGRNSNRDLYGRHLCHVCYSNFSDLNTKQAHETTKYPELCHSLLPLLARESRAR